MPLTDDLREGESVYISVLQLRAELKEARAHLAKLEEQGLDREAKWVKFLAAHPGLEVVVKQRVEILAQSGLLGIIRSEAAAVAQSRPSAAPATTVQAEATSLSLTDESRRYDGHAFSVENREMIDIEIIGAS